MSENGKLSCEEAFAKVYEYLDGELDASEEAVREHLETCKCCYPHLNFERAFLSHVQNHGMRAEPNDGLKARIAAVLGDLDGLPECD